MKEETDKIYFEIDFASTEVVLPTATQTWQQEILDFIDLYLTHDQIPVQTSGSTGEPKQMMLPKSAMQQSAMLTADFLDLEKGNTALLCLPIQYIAGKMMVVRAMESGLRLICVEPKSMIEIDDSFDFAAMTPMQAEHSLIASSESINSQKLRIKKLILGGAKVSKELESKLKNVDAQIYETYAMTETITHIAMRELNRQSEFHLLRDIQIKTDDRGCLVIKTPYFEEEIITNDLVEINSNNSFQLLGRIDNVINSGGIKINPEKIEEQLKPYISQPFIIHHKSDPTLGQKVVLVVESEEDLEITLPNDILPKNHFPKEIIFMPQFPRTMSGKIKRNMIEM